MKAWQYIVIQSFLIYCHSKLKSHSTILLLHADINFFFSIFHLRRKKQITKGGQYDFYIMQSGNFANHTIDIMGKNTSGSPKPTSWKDSFRNLNQGPLHPNKPTKPSHYRSTFQEKKKKYRNLTTLLLLFCS